MAFSGPAAAILMGLLSLPAGLATISALLAIEFAWYALRIHSLLAGAPRVTRRKEPPGFVAASRQLANSTGPGTKMFMFASSVLMLLLAVFGLLAGPLAMRAAGLILLLFGVLALIQSVIFVQEWPRKRNAHARH